MDFETNKILIYSPFITNRLQYIIKLILNKVLGLNPLLISEEEVFDKAECPKFSYSEENIFPSHPFLSANGLLFENDIHPVDIKIFTVDGYKAFFGANGESFFPFDLFSASFYLLSRYEEYLPFKADKYGRFAAESSLAFKEGFLEEPLVNRWAIRFGEQLGRLFPDLSITRTEFRFISTIDVDNAWAHLNKGFLRTFFSFANLLLHVDFKGFIDKIKVVFYGRPDPYDNYEFIHKMHRIYEIEPIFFFLFSTYSALDKSPSKKNLAFRKLIRQLSDAYIIGMHPSFKSNTDFKKLANEKAEIEALIDKTITISRQHYLRIKMPETFENLIKLGIEQDFSMGYSSHIGFRASFCMPYPFFNLNTNQETSLQLIPFSVMDTCFRDYLKIEPEKALKRVKKIISSIQIVNGLFVSIWHNETLGKKGFPVGWRFVFEQMLNELKNEYQLSETSGD